MTKKIAYFGPAGTYTEEAAIKYDPTAELIPFLNMPAVASAVETGMAEEGVLPIENSLEGSVATTLDLLIHDSPLLIKHELVLPIESCLLAKPGMKVSDVTVLFSHPQPLGQCRRFIDRCFPKAQVVASLSTVAAVEEMLALDKPAAAIGTRRAAVLYGAEILASGIQDNSANATRFVVLAPKDSLPTGNDKTSICFAVSEDIPGALCNVLQEFASRGINLTKIESRPSKESLGKYIFLVDMEGHKLEPKVAEVLEKVQAKSSVFKIFGSYPRYMENESH